MKIAILYEKTAQSISENIAYMIESHQCTVVRYQADEVWNAAIYPNPSALLQDVTHIVFILAENMAVLNSAYLFFLGMGVGRKMPIFVLPAGTASLLPENCRQFITALTVDGFERYFVSEQQSFVKTEQKKHAREQLLHLGFPCFDFNFVAAVEEGSCEVVQLFLDAGFDASLCDVRGTPVLSLAIRNGHYETTSLLLAHGADINLRAQDRSYSALMEAAQLGDLKTAGLLLERHADTDIQSKDGQTALILAVGRKDIPMVKLLSEHGANWKITDSLGMSALGYAKLFNNKDILSFAPDT